MVRCCTLVALLTFTFQPVLAAITIDGSVQLDLSRNPALGAVRVGISGPGSVVVTAPSAVTSTSIDAGLGGLGEVVVDGGSWSSAGQVRVGLESTGRLSVLNGGSFTHASGTATFGGPTRLATLEVAGPGSRASFSGTSSSTPSFNFHNGEVIVRDGAVLQSGGAAFGGSGQADVRVSGAGSLWGYNGATRFSAGELNITDGARIDTAGVEPPSFSLGGPAGSVIARIAGDSGVPSRFGSLAVGDQGYANLLVEGGADLSSTTTLIGSFSSSSPGTGNRSGVVTVTGRGSTWTTGTLQIASSPSSTLPSYGELRILDGATFTASSTVPLALATSALSTASVVVDGIDSRFLLGASNFTPSITIGQAGAAEFIVSGGAKQSSGTLNIGSTSNSAARGAVRVRGPGSRWTVNGVVNVINGVIELADGAELVIPQASTGLGIGQSGALLLDGGRSLSTATNSATLLNQGLISGEGDLQLRVNNSGNGRIVVGPGERLSMGTLSNSGSLASVEISDGTLKILGISGDETQSLTNTGTITMSGGTIETASFNPRQAFMNSSTGTVRFIEGANTIKGPFANQGGRVIVSGDSTVHFFNNVTTSSGLFSVSQGSTVYFLGGFSGGGARGDGLIVIEGVLGNLSPIIFGPDVDLTAATTFTARLGSDGVANRIVGEQSVSLGGELRLSGARPLATPGLHELTLVEAPEVLGSFDLTPTPGAHLGGRLVFRDIVYTDQAAKLVVEQFAAADLNADGLVNDLDGAAWSAAYGSTDWRADGNRDGLVDAADYTLWRDAMTASPLAIPEPTGLMAAAMVVAASVARSRRVTA